MNRTETFLRQLIGFKWGVLLISAGFLFLCGVGLRFLELETDSRVFFGPQNPQLKAMEDFEHIYTKTMNVLLMVEPEEETVFTPKTLKALSELTRQSWQIPFSNRVDSVTNFQHIRAAGDYIRVQDLVEYAEALTREEIDRIRQIALSEPALVNRLLSSSGHVAGVNILFQKPGKSPDEMVKINEAVRRMAEDFSARYPNLNVYISGGIPFDYAFSKAGENDMKTLVPFMIGIMVCLIGLVLRSVTGTLITMVIVAASGVIGMGVAGWLGVQITPATAMAPTIILTLAVADSIHILSTLFQGMRNGKTKGEALSESLALNLKPVFLTSATTAIGFLTMNFSDAPPFHDLGNVVAVGVVGAFLFSVTLLPALVMILPVRPGIRTFGGQRLVEGIGSGVVRFQNPLLFGMVGIVVLTASGTQHIQLEDTFSQYFDERYDIRKDTDFMNENLTGWNQLEYSVPSEEEGGIAAPAYLSNLEKLENWFRQQPKVIQVNSLVGVMKRLNRSMHGEDPEYDKIPDRRDLAAQYLLLFELSLPFGLDLNSQINVDKSSSRFTVTFRDLSTKELRRIAAKADAWIKDNLPSKMHTEATGEALMWAHISERNIQTMLGATLSALILISGILVFVFGSLKIGILSLIPNLSPAVMAFGLWGWFVGELGLAASVITAMTFGIVVDDTIHFLSKYLRARRDFEMGPEEAVPYSFRTVGKALIMTSVVLAGGFLVLAYSGFRVNSDMGILTSVTILLALTADFLFLPALLIKLDR